MAFDKPQSRNEAILQNMLGANNELEPPKSRVEALLQDIAGQMPEANPSEGTTTGTLERLKIGDDIYTVEGGGSGTSDYDALNNKPQIAGVTLSGDKSLADLGIASASVVSGILDGASIDSFADVETALAGKQDTLTFDNAPTENSNNPVKSGGVFTALTGKVNTENGKGLSTNDYSDTEKAQVATNASDIGSLKSGFTNLDNEVNGDATTYPYAPSITIEDAVPANLADCSVKIEPVQDLHGYDKPWVGGAGKNKCESYLQATIDSSGTIVSDSAYVTHYGKIESGKTYTISNIYDTSGKLVYGIFANEPQIGDTASGGRVVSDSFTFTAASDGYIAFRSNYDHTDGMLEEGTTATTYEPYSNICPISGHTEASVQRGSGNLLDENVVFGQGAEVTNYYTVNNDGSVTVLQSDVREYPWLQGVWLDKGTYTFSRSVANGTCAIADLTKNETIDRSNTTSLTFTLTERTYVGFKGSYYGNYPFTAFFKLERGETATPYVPYVEPKTYTIALGDTIYGGTVDFDSGVMTVTHKLIDMSDSGYTYSDQWGYSLFTSATFTDKALNHNFVCEAYKTVAVARDNLNNGEIGTYNTQSSRNIFAIRDDRFNNVSDFRTAVTGYKIAYELATPTTIQLTPQQIQLLKGTNTLTASTGQISVTANGVSGSIGAVQSKVNDHEERIEALESGGGTVKELRYTGTGTTPNTIDFGNDTPKRIMCIIPDPDEEFLLSNYEAIGEISWGMMIALSYWSTQSGGVPTTSNGGTNLIRMSFSGNTMTLNAGNAAQIANYSGQKYLLKYEV